jgi:hypothetical protein
MPGKGSVALNPGNILVVYWQNLPQNAYENIATKNSDF